jgi:NAD(P)-binding Rossmann-like domain
MNDTNFFPNSLDTVIIGGGFSGILMALKLSSYKQKIVLIESQDMLGGRLFSSGLQFEILDNASQEIYLQNIFSLLTEDEKDFLELFCIKKLSENSLLSSENNPKTEPKTLEKNTVEKNTFVVRKELTPLKTHFYNSTESFTKKEADTLEHILKSTETFKPAALLQDLKLLQELPKQSQKNLIDFISLLIEKNTSETSIPQIQKNLIKALNETVEHENFQVFSSQRHLYLRAGSGIETALKEILQNRQVYVKLECTVSKALQNGEVYISDKNTGNTNIIQTKNCIFAMPLSRAFALLPRDAFTANQSKFVTRRQPQSLVAFEVFWPNSEIAQGSVLLFPVEKIKAILTCENKIVFYSYLEFENSLNAPSIRDCVSRAKKALARLQKIFHATPEDFKTKHEPHEKIILISAAKIGNQNSICLLTSEVKMAWKNFYCCSDMHTDSVEPHQNIVESTKEIAKLITPQKIIEKEHSCQTF